MAKTIYLNGMNVYALNGIKRGFLSSLVEDAEHDLHDWDATRLALEKLSERDYERLCKYSFGVENVNEQSMEKCFGIIDDFIAALPEDKRRALKELALDSSIDFGISLYYSLLYDQHIMEPDFRPYVAQFRRINASASIGESIYGDFRVFFD